MPACIYQQELTQERLKEILDYDPDTGIFRWKMSVARRVKAGDIAGSVSKRRGYREIGIRCVLYKAHRLAWLYVYGSFPNYEIDHENGIKTDNRISNLRAATHAENQRNQGMYCNNKTGYKGVHWANREQKYVAQCSVNGREHNLGSFNTAEAAYQAYKEFASRHHGAFFRG